MNSIIQTAAYGLVSYIFMLIIVPILKTVAKKVRLTDKPNARKIHTAPVPLIGGIAIGISILIINMLNFVSYGITREQAVIIITSFILLLVGVVDDKFDINAKYKLLVQLFCAFIVAAAGNRITGLYGILGIHQIPIFWQYVLTITVIVGVVNAFNLMDGIDGLSGQLSIIGFSFLSIFSFLNGDKSFTILFVCFLGATMAFLKFNLRTDKIFMGDAGSLFIGSVIVNSSIYLLNECSAFISSKPILLYTIIGFLAVPVLDSLRVYLGRLKKGLSPFRPDKTHLHHLMLLISPSHFRVSISISLVAIGILLFITLIQYFLSITASLIMIVVIFSMLGFFLNLNKKVIEWRERIRELEK